MNLEYLDKISNIFTDMINTIYNNSESNTM